MMEVRKCMVNGHRETDAGRWIPRTRKGKREWNMERRQDERKINDKRKAKESR